MRYQSDRPKRQFLAGVKCPKCEALDKVVQVQIFVPQADEYIECTACGHTERRPESVSGAQSSLINTDMPTGTSGTVKFIP
ncbi:YheV family putative metal-binding protein [Psychrobacter sp. I-STPA6b]|uniref:YheV family putative metal-binding protein n=1 Tax=Psychrobacter sp. I-STPA6b TaxID=2585718 RepID=UPI001D0C93D8|nr:YheV family putative metal-binding protein [Psychrobacter sp. I-STPA6b]